jgi:hypothetical protein
MGAASKDFRKRLAAASACGFVDSSSRLDLLDKLASDVAPSVRGTAYELLFSADSGAIRDKYLTHALADSLGARQGRGSRFTHSFPWLRVPASMTA